MAQSLTILGPGSNMRDHMSDTHTVWWREEFREGCSLSGSQSRCGAETVSWLLGTGVGSHHPHSTGEKTEAQAGNMTLAQ